MDPVSQPDNEVPPPFGELLRQLAEDVIGWFDAERDIYGIQLRLTRRSVGWIALFALAVVVLAQGAMIAFVVGVLYILGPMIGRAWATLAIVVLCLVAALGFILLIRARLRKVKISWRRRHDG